MRSWPGILPPSVALAASLMATLVFAFAGSHSAASGAGAGLVAVALMPVPLIVAVIWAAALVMARPHRLAPLAAGLWLAAALPVWGGPTTWPLAGHVAAGLVAGVALGARWRLDVALAGVTAALLPLSVWAVVQLPLADRLAESREELMSVVESTLPAGTDEDQRDRALAKEREKLDEVLRLAERLYPFVLGLGLLAEALLILGAGWSVIRLAGWRLPAWRPPPFARWRMPFYLVWVLAAGLGLVVSRQPLAVTVGLNVALFAAALLSVQGVAVQFFVTARVLSPLGRVVFWTFMGLFFALLVLASGALLGLADQWLDLRRLDRGSDDKRGGDADGSAGAADDVGRRDR